MIKRITALLLALCLLYSAVPAYSGAAVGQRVYADAVTVTAGDTAAVTLYAENFSNVAALDVYIYYDATVFTVRSSNDGYMLSGAQASTNTAEAGTIKLSAMALDGMSGTGELLTVYFETKYSCDLGTYPISVAIGRAYDTDLVATTIGSANGSVTVKEWVATEEYYIYSRMDNYTAQKGERLTFYVQNGWRQAFVSGEFVVEYDHDLFAFDSVALAPEMTGEGAVYSVNSSILGQVRIAYANDDSVSTYELFSVELNVIADVDAGTTLKVSANNMFRENLTAYLPGSAYSSVQLQKAPEIADYPNAFLETERLVVDRQSQSTFFLEEGAGVAAADFSVTYDPAVLRCVSVTMVEGLDQKGGMLVINDNFSAGVIRFSYVNLQAPGEEMALVKIIWEPISSPEKHYQNTISAVGVVDAAQNPITLEYVPDTNCIYTASRTESTCQKEGKIEYTCACGKVDIPDVIPVIPESECTHYTVTFADEDGTTISSLEYHYGDAVDVPADPVKAEEEAYTYTFAGWDTNITVCVGDVVYTATYNRIRKTHVVVVANGNLTEYGTLAEAVKNAPVGSILRLVKDNADDVTISKSMVLDLNGFDLIGDITVSSKAKVLVKDSQTDDYTVLDKAGYGKLIGTVVGVQAANDYLMITEEDGVSFHRIDLEIHSMNLRPSAVGVYYQSNFAGDEIVAQNVERYGIALSVKEMPTEDMGICSWFDSFTPGSEGNTGNGTLLYGIMKDSNSETCNITNANMLVYGRAYLKLKDGRNILGDAVNRSLRKQVELLDDQWNTLSFQQQAAVLTMYDAYQEIMNAWDIPNIISAVK